MEKMKKIARISGVCIFEVVLLETLTLILFTEWYQSLFSDAHTAWAYNHYFKLYLCWGIIAGIYAGKFAEKLGHNYYVWFFYTQFLTVVSILHLYMLHRKKNCTIYARIKDRLCDWFSEKKQCEL